MWMVMKMMRIRMARMKMMMGRMELINIRCDGKTDCGDGSDEEECRYKIIDIQSRSVFLGSWKKFKDITSSWCPHLLGIKLKSSSTCPWR